MTAMRRLTDAHRHRGGPFATGFGRAADAHHDALYLVPDPAARERAALDHELDETVPELRALDRFARLPRRQRALIIGAALVFAGPVLLLAVGTAIGVVSAAVSLLAHLFTWTPLW